MTQNYLNLNESKTEIIWFGAPNTQNSFDLGNLAPFCKSVVKNLGVKFDSYLKFDKQINTMVKSCFFHLRSIAKVKPFLSSSDFERIIHAFISVRLDYCNSLYVGISQVLLNRLQLVQNVAARLLTGTHKNSVLFGCIIYVSKSRPWIEDDRIFSDVFPRKNFVLYSGQYVKDTLRDIMCDPGPQNQS